MTTNPAVDDSPLGPAEATTAAPARREEPPAGRGKARRLITSGWPPAALTAALTVTVLARYGVSPRETAVFGAYLLLCVALPGTLLVRATFPGARTLAEDLALGLTLGYALEVLAYMPARAAGAPLLVLLWPLTVYGVFVLVPRLRRHWTARPARTAPPWWTWFLASTLMYLVGWSAFTCFRLNALTWPQAGWAHHDLPFALSLIGELKHHMPPSLPEVAGEALHYHWFVYAHYAASSWITGIEPLTLLFRLSVLPMLAALVVIVGMTGRRVTGSRAGAVLAIAGTLFVATPSLYANANGLLRWTGVLHVPWNSPTQTFGALLFAPVVLVLIDLLTRPKGGPARWALLGVLLVVLMGAKSTYLPMLAAGLSVVAVTELLRLRRPPRAALTALGMTLACLAYAQLVLFGRVRQGTVVDPLAVARGTWRDLVEQGALTTPGTASVLGVTLVYVLCWAVTWCGVLGLLSRPRLLARPPVVLMLATAASGVGLMLVLGSPGDLNQSYFLQANYPYLAVLAGYGLLVVTRRERPPAVALACAAAVGMAAAFLIRAACHVEVPLPTGRPDGDLFLPFAVLLGVLVAATALAAAARRRVPAWALLLTMVTAAGAPAAWQARVLFHSHAGADGNIVADGHPTPEQIPQGALAAGHWLRAHSRPDELVATNAHCRWGHEDPCDSRHFWVSALSERRVLVEGWTYAATNLDRWRAGQPYPILPFWDTQRIRDNDAVFLTPSAAAVARLRDSYGVRWLVVDERLTGPGAGLERFAGFQVRYGDYAIYRLPDRPAS
ncbi:hypothetical protein [Sphaerisporangium fuscum]|uniref:hypothetical protein n=1 Tax=Sphaerisporangium fuscum TaxID=2835868 RepID=UPI001BDD3D2D|nr:hypothetical protein [Sphaerisporangium fuscum]